MVAWAVLTLGLLVRALAGGVLGRQMGAGAGLPAQPIRLDINSAGVPQLMALPGIGRSRAEAIVLHRVRHGPFRAVGDLDRVEGIGAVTLVGLLPLVHVGAAGPDGGSR